MNSPLEETSEKSDSLFAFQRWVFPRFLLFPVLAVVTYPFFVLGTAGDHWMVQAIWVVFLSYCCFCIGGSLHEAVHHTLFKRVSMNVWFGRILGLIIGIPYTVYKESHRRHHAYLNTPADYELWPYSDPKRSLGFRRIFVWCDLFFGVFTAPYIYGRIYFRKDPRLSAKVRRVIFWEYVAQIPFWIVVLTAIYFLRSNADGTLIPFNPIWTLPLVISPMINTARKFVEHIGLRSTDPFLGTRTILPGNLLSKTLSYFNFDIAVHGPHHRYPRSRHYELPVKLKEYQAAHPGEKIPVYRSYTSAFFSLLPLLWTFPATGDSQVRPLQDDKEGDEIDWERAPIE